LSFFSELKRRNVFRATIGYIISSWLLVQVADLVLENIGSPDWVIQTIMLVIALGFPVVMFFSWAYEVTPEGIKRESKVDRSESITGVTGRKLDHAITAVLVIALAYFAYDKFVLNPSRDEALVEATTQAVTEQAPTELKVAANAEKSIAVLPFVNMSSDPEQEYFSDGISEELLNGLTKIDSLKVAARTSSFSFKGQNRPIGEIAQVLGVAHILEGSVRKSGSQIRVTAQLIRVSDGFHMWSETYDRELVNIFAIQDEITEAIVSELRVKLNIQTQITSTTTDNPEAYQEYLRGRYFWNLRTTQNLYLAVEHFERATRLDPSYANAWTGLGEAWVLLPIWEFSDAKAPEQFKQARLAAEKALTLNPKSGRAHAVLAYRHMMKLEWPDCFMNYELALKYEPENASVWHWYAYALVTVGKLAMAEEAYQVAVKLEPLSRIINTSSAEQFFAAGQYDVALNQIDQTLAFAPDFVFAWQTKGSIHLGKNEFIEARKAFQRISELADARIFEQQTVDFIEESIRTGKPVQRPVWLNDPNLVDPYLASLVLVFAGQYEEALDLIERQSISNIPHAGAYFLNSFLFREKMGHLLRYQEFVTRLTTIESDKD
jgi:TolB-like protein/cytochrome c-type biogenesis protein CcmH/NrfG